MFGRNNDNDTQGPPPETPKLIEPRVFEIEWDRDGGPIFVETLTCRLVKESPAQLLFADAVRRSDGHYDEYIVKGIPWSRIVSFREVMMPATSGIIV